MRRRIKVIAFVSAPLDTLALSPYPLCSSFHSLGFNHLSDEAKQALKDAVGSSVHIIF